MGVVLMNLLLMPLWLIVLPFDFLFGIIFQPERIQEIFQDIFQSGEGLAVAEAFERIWEMLQGAL